jgi:hypothetical protein
MPFLACRTRYAQIALVMAQVLRADPPPPELLSRWRSLETSTTGFGSMLTFHANGVVDCGAGVVVESLYRIESGEMIVPPSSTNGPEQRQKMEFAGEDRLRLAELQLIRKGVAPDASHPVLGEWVGTREMSGRQLEVRYLFYPNGKSLLLVPFQTGPGRYSIRGSTMRLELPGHETSEGKFQIDGDVLTTPNQSGPGYRFRRY